MCGNEWTTQLEKKKQGKNFLYFWNCKKFSCKEYDWRSKKGQKNLEEVSIMC